MTLVVDGYNMIGAWPEFTGQEDLDKARLDLLDMLADYAGYSGEKITVVFDGYSSGRKTRSYEEYAGISVVFTRRHETADHYIERMIDELTAHLPRLARPIVRVATSDGLEQSVILSRGAVRLTAMELRRDVLANRLKVRKDIDRRRPVKPDALEGRVDPSARAWLDALRKRGGGEH